MSATGTGDPTAALTGARIFSGERTVEGHAVLIGDGLIVDVVPEERIPSTAARHALGGGLLAPGFVDCQVNGGGGVMFNHAPGVDGIRTIAAAHRRFGTTSLLPTLITDAPGTIPKAIDAVRDAIAAGVPGVLGIHIEGPFINVERKGAHDPALIRVPSPDDVAALKSLAVGRTLVTLAPENMPGGVIADLTAAGVLVAAGHTAASYEQTRAALAAGVTGFTHLFNAMTPLASRAPGVVGAALDDPDSWCSLIVDGVHVHATTLRLAIAVKRRGRMVLVTDAMATVGAQSRSFELYGETITEIDGRCANADGTLAGSALDMATAVRNTVSRVGLPVEEALRMASAYPADFLGLGDRIGRIEPGHRADLVLLDDGLRVVETWIGGRDSTSA